MGWGSKPQRCKLPRSPRSSQPNERELDLGGPRPSTFERHTCRERARPCVARHVGPPHLHARIGGRCQRARATAVITSMAVASHPIDHGARPDEPAATQLHPASVVGGRMHCPLTLQMLGSIQSSTELHFNRHEPDVPHLYGAQSVTVPSAASSCDRRRRHCWFDMCCRGRRRSPRCNRRWWHTRACTSLHQRKRGCCKSA